MDRKGVIDINFGMIFSIILIIAFIFVAFYAIKIFLDFRKCSELGLFKESLQEKINSAFSNDESSFVFSSSLPSSLNVCFVNFNSNARGEDRDLYEEFSVYTKKSNMFFSPTNKACDGLRDFKIEHINITKITESKNPYCIKNKKGKVEIKIEKGFYDSLVHLR